MKKLVICSLLGVILCAAAAAQPLKKSDIITDSVQSAILGDESGTKGNNQCKYMRAIHIKRRMVVALIF